MDKRGPILIATLNISYNDELYRLVDFLNRNLKDRQLMFGLSKNEEEQMTFSIYKC